MATVSVLICKIMECLSCHESIQQFKVVTYSTQYERQQATSSMVTTTTETTYGPTIPMATVMGLPHIATKMAGVLSFLHALSQSMITVMWLHSVTNHIPTNMMRDPEA